MILVCSSLNVGGAGFTVSVSLGKETTNIPMNIAENIGNGGLSSLLSSLFSVFSVVSEPEDKNVSRQFKKINQ